MHLHCSGVLTVRQLLPLQKNLWNISTNTYSTCCNHIWPVGELTALPYSWFQKAASRTVIARGAKGTGSCLEFLRLGSVWRCPIIIIIIIISNYIKVRPKASRAGFVCRTDYRLPLVGYIVWLNSCCFWISLLIDWTLTHKVTLYWLITPHPHGFVSTLWCGLVQTKSNQQLI